MAFKVPLMSAAFWNTRWSKVHAISVSYIFWVHGSFLENSVYVKGTKPLKVFLLFRKASLTNCSDITKFQIHVTKNLGKNWVRDR